MRKPLATTIILVAAGAAALAFPWTRNMYTGPVVLPQVAPRVPVEDAIAVDGPRILDRLSSQGLPNPRPNTPEVRDEGAWLYDVYCAIPHAQPVGAQRPELHRRVDLQHHPRGRTQHAGVCRGDERG